MAIVHSANAMKEASGLWTWMCCANAFLRHGSVLILFFVLSDMDHRLRNTTFMCVVEPIPLKSVRYVAVLFIFLMQLENLI